MPSLAFLAPPLLLLAAAIAAARPGRRPVGTPILSEITAGLVFVLAIVGLVQAATAPSTLILGDGIAAVGLTSSLLTASLATLVGFIGWVVLRYSRTYLDGERKEGAFHALMLTTLAATLTFVQAATLGTLLIATAIVGLALRRLLLFYAKRPEARRAATKFSLVWHAGDVALLIAIALLYGKFGTTEIASIGSVTLGVAGSLAVGLLVLTAALKSAAFPLHGWLTEVMEAPTPVSALLHAGVVNSGGVLLIALAPLIQASPGGLAALVILGGFTALFGATVMLTQSAVKTALAWSTVSQMGFLMLQCGLGLWALAVLHIVAHSLYKAHAFLASGGAVEAVNGARKPGPVAVPSLGAVMRAFGLALILYAVIAALFTAVLGPKTPQALAMGAILIFGVAYLVAQGLAGEAPKALTQRTILASAASAFGYFAFQAIAQAVWGPGLPSAPTAGPLEWALIVLAVGSFGLVAFAQALLPVWAHHPAMAGLRVHLANGLYLNALLDRAIGGFRTKPAAQ
ncbi:MAG: proton-conducting transporter transmembrane domain-containing protein [Shimia sp.]